MPSRNQASVPSSSSVQKIQSVPAVSRLRDPVIALHATGRRGAWHAVPPPAFHELGADQQRQWALVHRLAVAHGQPQWFGLQDGRRGQFGNRLWGARRALGRRRPVDGTGGAMVIDQPRGQDALAPVPGG